MADLSKIVCLEQDCRHGTEQTGGSGSGNDTYTKAEIDSKDADIRAAASEAKSVANNAQSVNQTQDGQIKALQRAVDNLHNYEHPAYSAHQLGFYKFANDEKGHITDAEEVTASDLYNAGGVIQSSLNLYDYIGYIPLSFMTLYYGGGLKDIAEIDFDRRDDNKRRVLRLCLGSREDRSTGCLRLIDYNGCQYDLRPNPDSPGTQMYGFYLPKQSGTLALTKDIPDISGKQDKSTAVTHSANTAVGSATKPVYIAANGAAKAISHSINSDVPANAKFTDTTYSDATQSTHGLMTAADKKKLDDLDASRFMNLNNSAVVIYGAGGTAQWYRLGTLVSSGNFNTAIIRILSGDGANGHARQNSSFEIHIKDAWQSTETASAKACGVTVYRINCANAEVKVIPTAHDTYTVWVYLPWGYWNGDYAVYGKYKSWTSQQLIQSDEPEGTGADTAYYDQAFLTSTVAKATEATALTETAWKAVPATGAAETVGRSIKYLKSGNTVFVQGSISFSASLNTPVCGKMPSDCLPNQKLVFTGWDIIGAPASFAIILDTDGKLSFLSPGTTAYWFKDHRAYSFNFSYHIN